MRGIILLVSHTVAVGIGFALGIYLLPILTAPSSPDSAMLEEKAQAAQFTASFDRDRRGSDFLHWGEGAVSIGGQEITHIGRLAPGPDYKLYLTRQFVEHEDEFNPLKSDAALVGDIKTFAGFAVAVPPGVDPADYNTVVVWCEAFGEFITSAQYQ